MTSGPEGHFVPEIQSQGRTKGQPEGYAVTGKTRKLWVANPGLVSGDAAGQNNSNLTLFAETDYFYCGRLHTQIHDHVLQPIAFGFCLLQQNLRAVLSSVLRQTSGTKRLSGAGAHFPGEMASVSVYWGRSLCILKPCDSIAERTFPVFVDLPDIRDTRSFSQGFGSPDVQTRRSG
jgi:hypothetical protein